MTKLNKTELRAACKEAGIKGYGKMTNDDMRAALDLHNRCGHVNCPHCGVHLSNGLLHCDDEAMKDGISIAKTLRETGEMTQEWECMGCGEQFGEHVAPVQPAADRHNGTGIKIEKDRPTQNGVTRPSAGGKCRAVWDALDELLAELEEGEHVTAKMVKDLAADEGWNVNNASIEFYRWRKFNGFTSK